MMFTSDPTAVVVEDIEQRRAQLADGKCYGLLAARVPHALVKEVQQAAKRAGTSMSDWLMQAAIEKIVNDESKGAGESQTARPRAARPRAPQDRKIKKGPMLFTSHRNTVRMLLQEAARWHATTAHASKTAGQLLAEYCERYRIDEKFRAEIDDSAHEVRKQAKHLKARTLPLDTSKAERR